VRTVRRTTAQELLLTYARTKGVRGSRSWSKHEDAEQANGADKVRAGNENRGPCSSSAMFYPYERLGGALDQGQR
jgi:hypothetical protein